MATQPKTTGLTYQDLQAFPEDNLRRELIDGELIVTAAPALRHQRVVLRLGAALLDHADRHGGEAFVAPTDVFLSEGNVVEPDVVYVRPENAGKLEKALIRSAPDLVVEVSSPSTRRLDLVRKRKLYERFGVPEYWFVDLDADRVEIYLLSEGRYGQPVLLDRGGVLGSAQFEGFSIEVDALLGPPED
jgi:Uma2 family endonuclease